jgi:hypothetical protein
VTILAQEYTCAAAGLGTCTYLYRRLGARGLSAVGEGGSVCAGRAPVSCLPLIAAWDQGVAGRVKGRA